jgi:hypothetical protein
LLESRSRHELGFSSPFASDYSRFSGTLFGWTLTLTHLSHTQSRFSVNISKPIFLFDDLFFSFDVPVLRPFSLDQKQKSRSNSVNASCLLNLLDLLLCSANKTGTSGGNKTTLLPGGSESGNS